MKTPIKYTLDDIKLFFKNTYQQFLNKDYFQEAFGYHCVDNGECPGTLGDVNIALHLHLGQKDLYPIEEKCLTLNETAFFQLVEFLYAYISKPVPEDGYFHSYAQCGWHYRTFDKEAAQIELKEKMDLFLGWYKTGYSLSKEGEIVELVANSKMSFQSIEKPKLEIFTHEFIQQQINKAKNKMIQCDYDGAITNARSLMEAIQEELIKKVDPNEAAQDFGGDLIKLYKSTKKVLKLNPSQDNANNEIMQILSGLNTTITGFAGLSNSLGDRHSRKHKVHKHHAQLAVNMAFTFCEFLLDTYDYQLLRKNDGALS